MSDTRKHVARRSSVRRVLSVLALANASAAVFLAYQLVGRTDVADASSMVPRLEHVVAQQGMQSSAEVTIGTLVAFLRSDEEVDLERICPDDSIGTMKWYLVQQAPATLPVACENAVVRSVVWTGALLTEAFGVQAEWGRWFVFDATDRPVARGDIVHGGMQAGFRLMTVRGEALERDFGRAIEDDLAGVPLTVADRDGPVTALLINFATTRCTVAAQIAAFVAGVDPHDGAGAIVVLPVTWSDALVKEFRKRFAVGSDVRVERATRTVQQAWDRLAALYGRNAVNGVLLTRSNQGALTYAGREPYRPKTAASSN